jgi:hypothetical protein
MHMIKCTALKVFSRFVPNYGIIHGDPENSDAAVRKPLVPVDLIDELAKAGKIKRPDASPAADADAGAAAPYSMTYVPVGRYRITGPDGHEEMVRGKKVDADKRLAALNDAASSPQPDQPAPTGDGSGDDSPPLS